MEEKRCFGCMKIKSSESICEHCGYDESTANEVHQLPAGTILQEQYMIGKVLGQGGFGITYLGWDMYLDIPVAIKEYFPGGMVMRESSVSLDVVNCSGDEGARFRNNKERFLREAKMLARFSQVPEIVQIRNFFLANNTAYIVMEYVQGITLKQYVKNQDSRLGVEETLSLMKPVIEALCKVHKTGLIHRDISPDNIMMLPGGMAKLLDFGAVRDVGKADVDQPLTKSTEAILKQGYAPIEQYQNRGSLGPWTDVYALCATIYYCLAGEVPPDAPERLLSDEELDFRGSIPELSEAQEEALKKGMALRAKDRIPGMDELLKQLYSPQPQQNRDESSTQDAGWNQEDEVVPEEKENSHGKIFRWSAVITLVSAVLVGIIIICTALFKENRASSEVAGGQWNKFYRGKCGENVKWELNTEEGTLLIYGNGPMDDFNRSWGMEEDNDYDPDRSLSPWLEYAETIHKVILNDGVTRIGDHAFEGCTNLTRVQWSETLESIGTEAFFQSGLKEAKLPESVTYLEPHAFGYCTELEEVTIPDALEMVHAYTFENCDSLKSLFIGSNTELEFNEELGATPFVGEASMVNCAPGLTIYCYEGSPAADFAKEYDIVYDYGLSGRCGDFIDWELDLETKTLTLTGNGSIDEDVQSWIYGISLEDRENWENEFPTSWIYSDLPSYQRMYAEEIEHINVYDVTHLNHYVFAYLPNLKSVDFGNSITGGLQLMDYAFYGSGLEEITVPETVTWIGTNCFYDCKNLCKVIIESDDAEILSDVFVGCESLEEVYFGKSGVIHDVLGLYHIQTYNDELVFHVYKDSDALRYARDLGVPYVIREE